MGADNRDWYRDWWARKTGYVEKARFRLPEPKPRTRIHWVLQLLAASVLVLAVLAVRSLLR